MDKYMLYELNKEKVFDQTILSNNIENDLIDSIADFIEMDSKKVAFFVERIGFTWIDEPDIIGATDVQKGRIIDLKNLLGRMF
jgi:hypothetical protein